MRQRQWVLVLLFFLTIITYLDRVCISVAGPRMQDELGISPAGWGRVTAAFTISYALFEVPSGALGDRIGTRKVLTRIVLCWSLFTSLTGMVSSYGMLLLVRFLFGAGEAGAFPNAAASIARWFPTRERGRATGIMWMGSRVGGALSALVMVQIMQMVGWREAFYVFGALGVFWALAWYWFYRDTPAEKAGITQAELDEIGTPKGEAHVSLPWGTATRSGNFWYILLMYHAYCWGSFFYLSWLHTFLVKGRGFTEGEMKWYGMLPFIIGGCCTVLGGWLSDRLSRRYGLKIGRRTVGAGGLAISGVLMLATALTPGKMSAIVLLALGYGAMDCMLPVSWAVCMDVGRRFAGTLSGAMNMAGQAASFLSAIFFGEMVQRYGDYNLPLIPMAGMLLVSALLFLLIDPTQELVPGPREMVPNPGEAVPAR